MLRFRTGDFAHRGEKANKQNNSKRGYSLASLTALDYFARGDANFEGGSTLRSRKVEQHAGHHRPGDQLHDGERQLDST